MVECEGWFEGMLGRPGRSARPGALGSQQVNGPGDAVARRLRITGPVETVTSACASGGLALGAALAALRSGEVDLAVAGGADALCQTTYAGFNALRSVDEGPCRPFRRVRAGLSLGEGAGVLVLETLQSAKRRGITPLAELAGAGASCDAHHMTAPLPSGAAAASAAEAALAEASLTPEAVDFVNAHGTGTAHNDAAEWAALRSLFGENARRVPVEATKALVGHLLGSAGALEGVVTVLGLRSRQLHAVPGDEDIDPETPVDLVLGQPRLLPEARAALSLNLAFGGANAAVVLTAWTGA
jgi:3-oxoacyl-[acyl-carrier-protein] synthase II